MKVKPLRQEHRVVETECSLVAGTGDCLAIGGAIGARWPGDAHDPVIGRHPECLQECLLGCWNFEVFIACCLVSPVENILIHWYGQWHRATIEEKPAKKKSEWKRRLLYFSSLNLEVFDRDIRQSMGDFWVTSLTSTISPNQIILTVKWSKYIKVSNLNDYIQIRQQSIKYHQLLLDPSKMNAILLLPIFTIVAICDQSGQVPW